MGLKDNFFQAMKELFGGESASGASGDKKAESAENPIFARPEPEQVQPPKNIEITPFSDVSLDSQFEERMKEMLSHSGLVGEDLQTQASASSALDSNLKKAETPVARPELSYTPAPEPQPEPVRYSEPAEPVEPVRPAEPAYTAPPAYTPPVFTRESAPEPARYYEAPSSEPVYAQQPPRFSSPYAQNEHETFPRGSSTGAEVTIISKNTLVSGNIRSFAGIYVEGNVSGNIEVFKNADINGKVIGNVVCSDTRLNGAMIQGDISSKGRVFMDKNAMLVGNISGQSMDVDGKVKGNIEVGGRIGLRENSVIIGNINAGTIAIADGANVQGYINTSFLRENADKVFPTQISVADEESAFNQRQQ